jgi:Tfp pilus assembly major pilin PilA
VRKQIGVTLSGLLIILVILMVLGLLALKVTPAYIEYFTAKKALVAVAMEAKGGGGVAELRKAFDRRAAVDSIDVVAGKDLEITKDGNDVVMSFSYRKEVPLFWNLGLYFDFVADSKGSAA